MITWVTAFVDGPADAWDVSRDFWTAVTGYGLSAARGEHADFQTLVPPDGDGYLRVQRLHDGGPRPTAASTRASSTRSPSTSPSRRGTRSSRSGSR